MYIYHELKIQTIFMNFLPGIAFIFIGTIVIFYIDALVSWLKNKHSGKR